MSDVLTLPVAPRYTRAVHLFRDFYESREGLKGYQVSPLVVQTASRILDGLAPEATARAFSVVGPFGAGKSAFGLFLAHYLEHEPRRRRKFLQGLGADVFATEVLLGDAPKLLPVLVPGNNSSLRQAVVQALRKVLTLFGDGSSQPVLDQVIAALSNPDLDPQEVADLVAQTNGAIVRRGPYQGLVVIIDELGQYLDFAARQQDERDLFVLQALAEMAARTGPTPCVVITILHQAFERYTAHAGPTRRVEWAKVQGRFVDLPFQEPPSQMIRMVARAIAPPGPDPLHAARSAWAAAIAPATEDLGLRPADIPAEEWAALVAQAYPLHPTVLVALPYLFRQLAQNERSLFAFLYAEEPWGLRDVLSSVAAPAGALPIYRLPHLFAYVEAVLGPSLFARARGQRWAELAETRALLGTADPHILDVLTTIGTIGALERSSGLRASAPQLALALADRPLDAATDAAVLTLQARRLITYRPHRDSYIIWEGSDLDLDGFTQEARRDLADRVALPALLERHASTTPQIARRHSYRTGATRVFAIRYVELAQLRGGGALPANADGEILCVVPANDEELAAALAWATAEARQTEPYRMVVIPRRMRDLRDLALDVAALQKVLDDRPEVEHDRVARREVASRLLEAQQALRHEIAESYGTRRSRWFRGGQEVAVRTAHQIDALLSAACDETYPQTPRVWNELIARRQLTSAAAKARRNLVEAMLTRPFAETLGLVGFPPERAIYESVLKAGGLHRPTADGTWEIGPPPAADPLDLGPAGQAMEAWLAAAETTPRPLTALYGTLEQPPFGIKAGLTPLLFVTLYAARAGEIVLYERGNFVPCPIWPSSSGSSPAPSTSRCASAGPRARAWECTSAWPAASPPGRWRSRSSRPCSPSRCPCCGCCAACPTSASRRVGSAPRPRPSGPRCRRPGPRTSCSLSASRWRAASPPSARRSPRLERGSTPSPAPWGPAWRSCNRPTRSCSPPSPSRSAAPSRRRRPPTPTSTPSSRSAIASSPM